MRKSRRIDGWACLLLLAAAVAVAGTPCTSRAQERPPNIVLVMVDDLGFSDLGVMGSEIETPHLDALAEQGMTFTSFYNSAKCEVTRATMLSGLYFHQTLAEAEEGQEIFLGRTDNNATIAELLGDAGYETILSGKWHLGAFRERKGTPVDRGFDHFFGHLGGAINYFTGDSWRWGTPDIWTGEASTGVEPYDVPDDFYSTDAFTDYAIERVTESAEDDRPFFLYLAYNAPHFPLHVPQENIDEYLERGTYGQGWDRLRRQRYERMKERGIIDPEWALSERDTLVPPWDTLTPSQQKEEELLMATFAGMVDRMDGQVGRLLERIDQLGIRDETVVLFLSDNGAHPFGGTRTPLLDPGAWDSDRFYGVEWAVLGNTPFRKYKQWQHEGGISTPLIVRWPGVVQPGTVEERPGHLLDVMPTLLDVAGVSYPEERGGARLLPLEGESLLPVLRGDPDWERGLLIHEYDGNRFVREGDWKLVAQRGDSWELYDLAADRTETVDLIDQHPERAARMAAMYDAWAARVGASSNAEAKARPLNTRPTYTFGEER